MGALALARHCDVRAKYASHLASRSALHLDLFEQPEQKRVFPQPAKSCLAVGPNVVGPVNTGYAPVKGCGYDPATAKKFLTEAGYPNGLEVTFWTPKGRYLKGYEPEGLNSVSPAGKMATDSHKHTISYGGLSELRRRWNSSVLPNGRLSLGYFDGSSLGK